MKTFLASLGVVLQIFGINSLIIPDEVPSLLSVIYSNIPTIKKGTDSRVGWGFRLGDRADFQFLVELGPQTNTKPLANQGENSNSKRHVANSLRNALYAQQEDQKYISDTDAGKWLDQWRETMKVMQTSPSPMEVPPDLGVGEIDAKDIIPDDATLLLQELYKQRNKNQEKEEEEATTSTPENEPQKPLDDVSLDDDESTTKKDALDNVDFDK